MSAHKQRPGRHGKYYYMLIVFFLSAACGEGNKDTRIDDDNEQDKTFAVGASYSNLGRNQDGRTGTTQSGF
ncbi:hypothetical protein J2X69_000198 [Algoriphagus sp. 4150]|uniref:hypothetical protein n=1 Tax=Algoriphagus sp. 4150 TaxID=2817756 RepID=UPI00285AA3CF|nr:hypothetical protein [Algoriphagus sp. 4150]MDR7127870.1 hypothetical protein [Algoriphagus sp. 4150]